jgi:hypothetical protein
MGRDKADRAVRALVSAGQDKVYTIGEVVVSLWVDYPSCFALVTHVRILMFVFPYQPFLTDRPCIGTRQCEHFELNVDVVCTEGAATLNGDDKMQTLNVQIENICT